MKVILIAALLLWPSLASAQVASTPPEPSTELSDIDRLDQQVLDLRVQLESALASLAQCQGEAGQMRARLASDQLTAEEQKLKARIEDRHTGFDYDPKTHTLTKKTAKD